MTGEELWKAIQKGMGFTDQEMALVKEDPYRRGLLESGPQMVRTRIVGEIIEAKNCAAHPVGTRYVTRGNGVLRTEECSPRLCVDMLALMTPVVATVMDRFAQGQDPRGKLERYIHCPDVGARCGGFGTALMKVTVE